MHDLMHADGKLHDNTMLRVKMTKCLAIYSVEGIQVRFLEQVRWDNRSRNLGRYNLPFQFYPLVLT